jgi:oxygen-independent coproporphyrinogen-3 oxidase
LSLTSSHPHDPPGGIYIHIPFCIKKCLYCDFYSVTDLSLKQSFIRALCKEIRLTGNRPSIFDSIHFGGGTPSLFAPRTIETIMAAVHRSFPIQSEPEITMEINPGTADIDRLRGYREAGVNRVSIGVQSFQRDLLKILGRLHTPEESDRCINAAQTAGIENIALDLIFGIPGQTKDAWHRDLEQAVSYHPDHLSCYLLTYEPGTPLEDSRRAGRFVPMSEETAGALMETAMSFLSAQGYIQYEISNYARSVDKASHHNAKYWSFAPYIGLGPAAHSFSAFSSRRWWNHADMERYMKDLDAGRLPVAGEETLTREQRMTEAVYLGLRKMSGIDIRAFNETFAVDFNEIFRDEITALLKENLISVSTHRIALTRKGIFVHNGAVEMFLNSNFFRTDDP